MVDILIGAGIIIAGMVILVALIALGPVTLLVGAVGVVVGMLYMAGYAITHGGTPPHESWPIISMAVGLGLCILGGAADDI